MPVKQRRAQALGFHHEWGTLNEVLVPRCTEAALEEELNHLTSLLDGRGCRVHRTEPLESDHLSLRKGLALLDRHMVEMRSSWAIPDQVRLVLRDLSRRTRWCQQSDGHLDGEDLLVDGRDVYVSDGDELGRQWLKDFLGPSYTVHPISCRLHLQQTLAILSPRLLLCSANDLPEGLPSSLESYEKIVLEDDEARALELLVLDSHTAMVGAQSKPVADRLTSEGHEVITLPWEAMHAKGVGLRSCVLPLVRTSIELAYDPEKFTIFGEA